MAKGQIGKISGFFCHFCFHLAIHRLSGALSGNIRINLAKPFYDSFREETP
jgi:hypothetical protein